MQKKKEEEAARDKELNELFKVAISQPKVPVGMVAVALRGGFLVACVVTELCQFPIVSGQIAAGSGRSHCEGCRGLTRWLFGRGAGVDPKSVVCEFFRHGQCAKGFKCKYSHDLSVERKGEKIDIYSDQRDEGERSDGVVGCGIWLLEMEGFEELGCALVC